VIHGTLVRGLAAAALLLVGPAAATHDALVIPGVATAPRSDTTFAAVVARLSEPGGYFDSDNLVSNEASYLHVLGRLRAIGVRGGAYIGVGPDQNFSYLVHVKPRIALMIDIRRDNLLMHLLYKSIFSIAPTRADFVSLLFGRTMARDLRSENAKLEDVLDWVTEAPVDSAAITTIRARVLESVRGFGVPLDARDIATIERFHGEFIVHGPELRYSSIGRPPRASYPSYRMLALERDLEGRQSSYLASEESYRWLRDFQLRGLVVPVVGNLAGEKALSEITRFMRERGDSLSVFYASNVEQYLMRDGLFARWAENLLRLPRNDRSVVIRSYFGRQWSGPHPNAQPGYMSTQLVQRVNSFAREWQRGSIGDYWSLVTQGVEEP
jgi:hypothetical protein